MKFLKTVLFLFLTTNAFAGTVGLQDEGTTKGFPWILDCQGGGVECSMSGSTGIVAVTGDAGGSGRPMEVKNNGATLTTNAILLNFTSGNLATVSGQNITIAQDTTTDYAWTGAHTFNSPMIAEEINDIIYVDGTNYAQTDAGIEAAMSALPASGGKVILPEGTYTISAEIDFQDDDIILEGVGNATILALANGADVSVIDTNGKTNIVIRDLYIDGNSANQSALSNGIIDNVGSESKLIENVYISDVRDNGIDLGSNAIVNNCIIDTFGASSSGDGIIIISDSGATISNNIVRNGTSSSSNGIGVASVAGQFERVTVVGNLIHNNGSHGINVEYSLGVTVTGNVAYSNTKAGIAVWDSENVTVSDNVAKSNTQAGIDINNGDGAATVNGVVVLGNQLYENTLQGINIDLSVNSSNIDIAHNIIRNNGAEGILIEGAADIAGLSIEFNRIYDDQGSPTQTYGIRNTSSGTITDFTELGNFYSGNTTAIFSGLPTDGEITTNSNFAIGTTSPLLDFEVNGTASVTGIATFGDSVSQSIQIDGSNGTIEATAGGLKFKTQSAQATFITDGGTNTGTLFFGNAADNYALRFRAFTNYDQVLFASSDSVGNQIVLTTADNYDKDHDHAVQTNPTLFVHSNTDPDTANDQWMSMTHNQTSGYISSSKGGISLDTSVMITGNTTFGGTTTLNGVEYTWPSSDGAANEVLHTDGNKVLSWDTDDSGGGALTGIPFYKGITIESPVSLDSFDLFTSRNAITLTRVDATIHSSGTVYGDFYQNKLTNILNTPLIISGVGGDFSTDLSVTSLTTDDTLTSYLTTVEGDVTWVNLQIYGTYN